MRKILFLILLLLSLAACGGNSTATSQPIKSMSIACTAAYRADVSQPIEREETLTFGDADAEQSIAFADMVFHAAYSAGKVDNERALRLWVTDVTDTAVYQTQLYQLEPDSGPQNQFVGGHGFTGLSYSYHPMSSAEMQFWCEAS